MNVQELLNGPLGQQMVDGVSSQLGIGEGQAKTAVSTAVPLLLTALNKNAENGDANNIINALSKHDGSILDNISGFLNEGNFSDGNSILGHVLGNKQNDVSNAVAKSSGLSAGQISQVLAMIAPIVMGYLGKEKNQGKLDGGDLTSVLGSLLGGDGQSSQMGGLLDSLLGESSKKGGGLSDLGGKILGGLFGGKK